MRVVIATDKFKGSLSAREAAEAIARGIGSVCPQWELDLVPVADGGEGTMEVLLGAKGGSRRHVQVQDPLGRSIEASYGWIESTDGPWAVMEMSEASGLWRLRKEEYEPLRATTFGTGQMMADAARSGARKILIGIGGSATNDGGSGLARALGYRFLDEAGKEIPVLPAGLKQLARIERREVFSLPPVQVMCDVTNPLLGPSGATRVFGPQKGADAESLLLLEEALVALADVVEKEGGKSYRDYPGAGAAGGLGFGLMVWAGAQLSPGFDLIAESLGLAEKIAAADLVITGEGCLDGQTAQGKAPSGVVRLARQYGKPVIAFAGKVEDASAFDQVFSLVEKDPLRCFDEAAGVLESVAAEWALSRQGFSGPMRVLAHRR